MEKASYYSIRLSPREPAIAALHSTSSSRESRGRVQCYRSSSLSCVIHARKKPSVIWNSSVLNHISLASEVGELSQWSSQLSTWPYTPAAVWQLKGSLQHPHVELLVTLQKSLPWIQAIEEFSRPMLRPWLKALSHADGSRRLPLTLILL